MTRRYLVLFSTALTAQLIFAAAGKAEQLPTGDSEVASQQAIQEIDQAIDGLTSLKDYERLSSILASIQKQEDANRNELWRHLDRRIDALSAGAVLVLAPEQPSTSAKTITDIAITQTANQASKSSEPIVDAAAEGDVARNLLHKNAVSPEQEQQKYNEASQQVERLSFNGDLESRRKTMNEAAKQILTVQNKEQREQLGKRLNERFMDSVDDDFQKNKSQTQKMLDAFHERYQAAMNQLQAAAADTKNMPVEPAPNIQQLLKK